MADSRMTLEEYFSTVGQSISQESERTFVKDFMYPLLGADKICLLEPQHSFIDSEGICRRADFFIDFNGSQCVFEIDGETYHSESFITSDQFDDNLFRQNEISLRGWHLLRISYNQLLSPLWRERVMAQLRLFLNRFCEGLLEPPTIQPNPIQREVLHSLDFYRTQGWDKGLVVMPTGTGKTYLSALDSGRFSSGRTLFVVHKLDILAQSRDAYENVRKNQTFGLLTGKERTHLHDSDVLFASKDTLYKKEMLEQFRPDDFDYVVIDEVHHGQAPTYRQIIDYFKPKFMLGMTATPERTDRKDILELFDYRKVCEYDLNDAISRGFLVAYSYYGLTDNIDYSQIRHDGRRYNVTDLENTLIIEKRNQAIYNEYMKYCSGSKALAFCVSIKHSNRMADFFTSMGVKAISITSEHGSEEKARRLKAFRNNEYAVAFTVDVFNEGIDIPNIRALLLLRPTESKTIFIQELGRGLRLSSNKEKLIILDFIGNYKRANLVREYLSTGRTERTNKRGAFEKYDYHYNPKCEVHFDAKVQEILEAQDRESHEPAKADLIENYYTVAEKIGHKPSRQELFDFGEYTQADYIRQFGSWLTFLREIGEVTESGYHYPQGMHLGHVNYFVMTLKNGNLEDTYLDEKYLRLRGDLDDGKLGRFQRQTKYKALGMMEMGLLVDDREHVEPTQQLELTKAGYSYYYLLEDILDEQHLAFKNPVPDSLSWTMEREAAFNVDIWNQVKDSPDKTRKLRKLFMQMDAYRQMLTFFYCDIRKPEVAKRDIYSQFFKSPRIRQYCDQCGIEPPSDEAAKHRLPFILNMLEASGIIRQNRSSVEVSIMLLNDDMLGFHDLLSDTFDPYELRKNTPVICDDDAVVLKELFGHDYLTNKYWLSIIEVV